MFKYLYGDLDLDLVFHLKEETSAMKKARNFMIFLNVLTAVNGLYLRGLHILATFTFWGLLMGIVLLFRANHPKKYHNWKTHLLYEITWFAQFTIVIFYWTLIHQDALKKIENEFSFDFLHNFLAHV